MEAQQTTKACNHNDAVCIESNGAIKDGHFVESYECAGCGATGTISGNAEDPETWTKTGQVFR